MTNKKRKINTIRLLRAAFQIILFIFLPGLYISVFSGIKQIYISVIQHQFNFVALLPQEIEAIAIIPATILLGRFFCGWACAFGSMEDFISMLSRRVFKHRFRIGEKTDRALKWLKYVVLVFLIAAVWTFGVDAFQNANPWDAFGMLSAVGKMPNLGYVATNLAPALIILVLIIAASFFVDRFFCRYLCPLGAVFTIISKLRVIGIRKPKADCGKCRACAVGCPMGIALYEKDTVRSGECINCFSCVSACPRGNVSVSAAESDLKPALTGALAVAAMVGIYYAGTLTTSMSAVKSAAAPSSYTQEAESGAAQGTNPDTASSQAASDSQGQYKDGTYQGSGTGFRGGTTTVSVIVSGGKVTDVSVVSTDDDARFFNRAYPVIDQEIIFGQSAEVNAVSGATFSSRGIMSAVTDALSKAV